MLNCKGSVLLWVVLCIAVLMSVFSTLLAALLSERRSIAREREILRAEVAVQAALVTAQSLLCETITKHPDSATVWMDQLPGLRTPGTAIYIFERPDPQKSAKVSVIPLISKVDQDRSFRDLCDLSRLFPNDWPRSQGKPLSVSAHWVLLSANQEAPLLTRYAFFLEDESFKLNIQEASSDPISPLRSAKDLSLEAILSQVAGIDASKCAKELFLLRTQLGGFDDVGQVNSLLSFTAEQWANWKALCTIHSDALNFTRRGLPRTNLNKLFYETTLPNTIQQQLNRFVLAIRRESPYFGQRFYRLTKAFLNSNDFVSKTQEEIYLNKLAANIRDFLLPGPNPTRIAHDYRVLGSRESMDGPPRPDLGRVGPNPLIAVGKKRIPYLQEYALVARMVRMTPKKKNPQTTSGAEFEITLDHFFEFWNLSNRPIRVQDLGSNARLIIKNQPPWDLDDKIHKGWGIPQPSERDIEIPLTNFRSFRGGPLVFHPGRATVLTTYPELPPRHFFPHGEEFFTAVGLASDRRSFSGITYRTQNGEKDGYYEVRTKLRNQKSDHETWCLLVNDSGWIDGFGYLPILESVAMRHNNGQAGEGIAWYIRSSALQGRSSKKKKWKVPEQRGDPRTLNEQLVLGERGSAQGKNLAMNEALDLVSPLPHTRFLENAKHDDFPGSSSWGAVRSSFVDPEGWPDPVFSELGTRNDFVAAVFAEGPLKTIAELGHVFDPIRNSISQIDRDRGGGRTLRIGQPEFYPGNSTIGIWDGDPLSPSREWTAWRLCDIFSVTDEFAMPGAVNINAVLRADGAILRALLHHFCWDRGGSRELGGYGLNNEDISLIIRHFQQKLRGEPPYQDRGGPFFERGEISEIDLFQNEEAFPTTFSNQSQVGLAERNDRVREEVMRHIMQAITTRGNVFSAYCIGQAVRRGAWGNIRVLATRKAKFTFRLVPLDQAGRLMQAHSPAFNLDNQVVAPPVRYGIEMLARED